MICYERGERCRVTNQVPELMVVVSKLVVAGLQVDKFGDPEPAPRVHRALPHVRSATQRSVHLDTVTKIEPNARISTV